MSTILLTGSQGFIGCNIRERFADRWPEHKIIGLDKVGDVELPFNLLNALEWEPQTPVDAIFHLAAVSGVRTGANYEHNVSMTIQLIVWATKHNVKTIVYSSSSSVYGDVDVMDESQPCAPISEYGKSKLRCEELLNAWAKRTGGVAINLRLFNNLGLHQRRNMLPSLIAESIINKKPLELFGYRLRGWTYVGDTVRAFHSAFSTFHNSLAGRSYTFNVGTGDSINQRQLIDQFEAVAGSRSNHHLGRPDPSDVQSTRADTARFQSVFGWVPETSNLVHGINEVLTTVRNRKRPS